MKCLLLFILSSVGSVAITSPNTVTEGNLGETAINFNIVVVLQISSVPLGRDVVYTVQVTAGTATG